MKIEGNALANLKKGLALLSKEETTVYYRIVRVDGPKGTPFIVFGTKLANISEQAFEAAWKGDETVSGSDKSKWVVATGAIVRDGDEWKVVPSSSQNRVVDGLSVKALLKEVRALILKNSLVTLNLDGLLKAMTITAAADLRQLESAKERNGPLGVTFGSLAERLRAVELVGLLKQAQSASEDKEKRKDALQALREAEVILEKIEHDAQQARAGIDKVFSNKLERAEAHREVGKVVQAASDALAAVGEAARKLESAGRPKWSSTTLKITVAGEDLWTKKQRRELQAAFDKVDDLVKRTEGLLERVGTGATAWQIGRDLVEAPKTKETKERKVEATKTVKELRVLNVGLAAVRNVLANADESATKGNDPKGRQSAAIKRGLQAAEEAGAAVVGMLDAIETGKVRVHYATSEDPKRKKAREVLVKAVQKSPDVLKRFVRLEGGAEELDRMVSGIGEKAGDAETRTFLARAIEARFGIREMSGGKDGKGLSSKALPRLYGLLLRVPKSHVEGLPRIVREKEVGKETIGTYNRSGKVITIAAGSTGRKHITRPVFGTDVHAFDHTTLHELGHAVDHKRGIMDAEVGKNPGVAGWRRVGEEDFCELYEQGGGEFFKLDVGVALGDPSRFLRGCLVALLKGRTINAEHGNVQQAWKEAQPPPDPITGEKPALSEVDFTPLSEHPEVERLRDIWDEGAKYKEGKSGAKACTVGGGTLVIDRTIRYVYDPAERDHQVSDYQFAGPEEWFAELYAAYYEKLLPKDHRYYAWLEKTLGL